MWPVLLISGTLVAITAMMHFSGLVGLSWVMRQGYMLHPDKRSGVIWQGLTIVALVMGLFLLHVLQIIVYALVYLAFNQFSSFEPALYFSATTFTTVGYGDVVLTGDWRILGAAQSANGFLLLGWSTAFLVSVTSRVRSFAAEFVRPAGGPPDITKIAS